MTLDELLKTVWESSFGDWTKINGPTFLEWGDRELGLAHEATAVYKPDPTITIAWGLTAMESFSAPWTKKFPAHDPIDVWSCYLDIFYCGALVHREMYVELDGGRCSVPLPRTERDDTGETKSYFPAHLDRFWQNVFIPLQGTPEPYGGFGTYEWYRDQTGIPVKIIEETSKEGG